MDKSAYTSFMSLVKDRYSCRDYKTDPVSDEMIDAVIEAARLAPSAVNRQPWRFIVITQQSAVMEDIRKAYRKEPFKKAPVCIVAVGLHDEAWHRPVDKKDHTDVDVSIAIEHICLAASALGLATCWVCSYELDIVRDVLGLKENEEAVALIPLGYPADQIPEKTRKPLSEILTRI